MITQLQVLQAGKYQWLFAWLYNIVHHINCRRVLADLIVISFMALGVWREVSVRGDIYSLRETRSIPSKSQKVDCESNVLVDGTLIDLCGATLVWRSHAGKYSHKYVHLW